jgi:hypothetical protein
MKEDRYRRSQVQDESDRLVNNFLNSRSEARSPSSVSTTDFALLTGFEIRPFACSRLRVSQSKPFPALAPSCRVKYRSARTASSIFSASISIVRHLLRNSHRHRADAAFWLVRARVCRYWQRLQVTPFAVGKRLEFPSRLPMYI